MKKAICILLIFICGAQVNAQIINKKTQSGYGSSVKEIKETPLWEFKKQRMISLSMSDMVFTNITARYEFFKKDGKVGFQIPFSFNAGGVPDTNQYRVGSAGRFLSARNRIFQTGLNINYYLVGQDKVSPFVGVSLAAGWFNYWRYDYTQSPTVPYQYNTAEYKEIGTNVSFAFHAGFLFNPWETLTFSIKGGLGLRRYGTIYNEYTYPFGLIDLSTGFKF